ncbi:hypothetical protein SAMN02745975_01683 [Geosporobacter subterraneus DSM 17957]|uniref:Uncharacterized protein n=1 Tax=Geosporobacter subterraneus DSM 17957 TaxID=1121919 RepID=A0A1M6HZG9_9FIRM|nr:hypothetical protein [Geosporobacter subterraneus]SHJ27628.1 hypothetical protein SAMN02745975_01683 [Geosporobacter subterraneus DSM 17957]
MKSKTTDITDIFTSKGLTYQQKLFNLANVAERLLDPRELLGYTDGNDVY